MNKWILAGGVAAGAVGLWLLFKPSATRRGAKNSGLGGSRGISGNTRAFPVGQIASSAASLGSSIFGAMGTHNPSDPSIKPAGATGDPLSGRIITSYDGPTSADKVPSPDTIQTQIDGYNPNAVVPGDTVPSDPVITTSDFSMDTGV